MTDSFDYLNGYKHQFSTLVDLLRYRSLHQPDRIAYTFLLDGETSSISLTYQELDEKARAIAAVLQQQGVTGERALLLYPPGLEFIAAFFGCLYAGVVAVPAYPPKRNHHSNRLQGIVTDAQATIVLTTRSILSNFDKTLTEKLTLAPLCCIITDEIDINQTDDWQPLPIDTGTLAFLQYTSGSTGTPKGVMVSHGNLLHNLFGIHKCFEHTPNSRGVIWLPLYHDMGLIGGVLQPIYGGFPVTLMPPVAFLQKPIRWLKAISRYQATTSGGPNFAYEFCVNKIKPEQIASLDLSSWEVAFTGAEPVRAETLERFATTFASCGFRREAFYPCYGMAETTLLIAGGLKTAPPVVSQVDGSALEQNQVVPAPGNSEGTRTIIGCGRTWLEEKIAIVEPESLTKCAASQVGEIWVSGASVAQGYWNQQQKTQQTFHGYLADTGEGPFLRTGDLGFVHNGELFVTGRLKDLIIIRGRNHYPQDIELTVERSHPALRLGYGAAFAVEVEDEERLVIVQEVERRYLRNLDVDDLIGAIRQEIAQEHSLQPFTVLLLKTNSIPKTSSGKIQRYACKAGFLDNSLDVVGEWIEVKQATGNRQQATGNRQQAIGNRQQAISPTFQAIQAWLISQIAERLVVEPQEIDIREPFSHYGLDSVAAVTLSGELEEWLGRKLAPTLAYDYPSIEALARYLSYEELAPPTHSLERRQKATKRVGASDEVIAIIGIGCRLPGAKNPQAFWQLLRNGVDAITEVPTNRWHQEVQQPIPQWGGFLEQVDQFDPQFFGITPREAQSMDPQQRLLLEVSWEALENAGIVAEKLARSETGVFIGISSYDYSRLQLPNDPYSGTGNALSIAANRLSYLLDVRGPSWSVDTACSSSLVAVHQATQSLQQGECQLALAGGVNLILSPELSITFAQAGMIAADGRCKTFSADADGYVRGEGCGIVVLKRLADALKDGDNVLALIKGTAVNQDGRSNGLTAPNGPAQQAVIRKALENAGVEPTEISYFEAHGTGTSLGDPIEVNSLKQVLMKGRSLEQPCWLGSVKTNIGHLEAAAGIAGLIKVVLSLQHTEIPPHLHLQKLNPHIDLENTPLAIPTELQEWQISQERRLAGVSSFGFGGTNAHIILEEAAAPAPRTAELERPQHLLTLSAKSEQALAELAQAYATYLQNSKASLADICFTANTARTHFEHRLAIIAESTTQLQEHFSTLAIGKKSRGLLRGEVSNTTNPKLAFLFTGQSSQYIGMGRRLYQTQPTFRQAINRCAEILHPYLEKPLLELLYSQVEDKLEKDNFLFRTPLDETTYTQPALFALEYALAQLWQSWGIKPTVVVGHSVGEYVAACVAGVFNLEDGLKLIAQRARLMQALPKTGEMVVVFASEAVTRAAIQPYAHACAIAAVNSSENIVISGEEQAIAAIVNTLAAQGIKTQKLQVSHAFHSPLMEPMLEDFERVASEVTYSSPQIDLISNLTGELATTEITTPEYWCRHVRESVRFAASMETLLSQGYEVFVEIGPKPTLLAMARNCLPDVKTRNFTLLPSLREGKSDWQQMLRSLATLYLRGIPVDWSGFDQDYPCRQVVLPTYPFQRQRYWVDSIQFPIPKQQFPNCLYEVEWQPKARQSQDYLQHALTVAPKEQIDSTQIPKSTSSGSWLILADTQGIGQQLATILRTKGEICTLAFPGKEYQKLAEQEFSLNPANPTDFQQLLEIVETTQNSLRGVVHLWSLEPVETPDLTKINLDELLRQKCGSTLHLVQALVKTKFTQPTALWLVTRGAQPVGKEPKALEVSGSPLWGMGKVIALEHPELNCVRIDLDPEAPPNEVQDLFEEIWSEQVEVESRQTLEDQVAFRGGIRQVARLVHHRQNQDTLIQSLPSFREDGTYLITGGNGGLGLLVSQWMVEQGARHLVLVGRSSPKETVKEQLKELEQSGAKVVVTQADVCEAEQVAKVLAEIEQSLPPLRGVIHAAGILDDGILLQQTWERFHGVMAPKIQGAWHLHNLTQNQSLDFFVFFSSAAALLGSPGQANYAAANAFLDALAHYRRTQGLPGLSINWGVWSNIGLAAKSQAQERIKMKGVDAIAPEQGLQIFGQLLTGNAVQVGVVPIRWLDLLATLPVGVEPPFLSEIVREVQSQPTQQDTAEPQQQETVIFEQLLAISATQREEFLLSYLQQQIAQVLQLQRSQLPLSSNLLDLGMDSLMVMEAINLLKQDLQLMLYPREFYERPRIDTLAKYIATEFQRVHTPVSREQGAEEMRRGDAETRRRGDEDIKESFQIANSQTTNDKQQTTNNKLPGIIFILSSPRSGSTLLRVMLAGHPDLFSPPELHLLPFTTMKERHKELALSFLGEGLQRAFMEIMGIDGAASQALVKDMESQNLSIQQVYAKFQKLAGKRLLVDKSPTYAMSQETLARAEQLFAGGRYIHLVRHPYAMMESFVRLRMDKLVGKGDANPYQLAEQVWTNSNQNILNLFQHLEPERHYQLRYEELVKDPAQVMSSLCEFLGIPFKQELLKPYEGDRMTDGVHPTSVPINDPNFFKHNNIDPSLGETWKTIKLPHQLGESARQIAAQLEYELPREQGAEDAETRRHGDTETILNSQFSILNSPAMGESYLDVRSHRLCLCTWGPEAGPLVLCLHGILEQGAAWEEVAIPLAKMGYRVVAPDLRGHGRSSHISKGNSAHLVDFLGDVDAIVAELTDQPFILVGHSIGSVLAAMYASVRLEKVGALVLLDTVLPSDGNDNEVVEQLATHLDYLASPSEHPVFPDVATAASRLRLGTPTMSEALALKLAKRITEPCDSGVRWRWDPMLRTRTGIGFNGNSFPRARYLELLRQIQAPITLIYGDTSHLNRTDDLSEQQAVMPQAKRVFLSGGHNLHIDAPQAIASLIAEAAMNCKV